MIDVMVLDNVQKLMQHGSFQPALDLIEDHIQNVESFSEEYIQTQILRSRAYYHLGRLDQALYFVSKVLEKETEVAIDDVTRLHLYSLRAIFQLGVGEYRQGEATLEMITSYVPMLEEAKQNLILSHYYYAMGDLSHQEGDIEQAINHYKTSLEHKTISGENYELNFLLYKMGVMYRMKGELHNSKDYLEQSLAISRDLSLVKEQATAATLLGQDLLMSGDYGEAREFIEEGLSEWTKHGSIFGIMWALGELAILDYLDGDYEQALQNYIDLYLKAKDVVPSFQLSNHLLNIIRIAVAAADVDMVKLYLSELKELADEEENDIVDARFHLGNALSYMQSKRITDKMKAHLEFDQINQLQDVPTRIEGLLNQCRLLLYEHSITEEQLLKTQIRDEVDDKVDLVLEFIRNKSNITFELHASAIRSELEILRNNEDKALEFLDILENKKVDIKIFDEKIDELTSELVNSAQISTFNFSKEFHSIPKIKILLYLLPRHKVLFSELQRETQLSSGNLTGQCDKLEELGVIFKEKDFVNTKPSTFFGLTPQGYLETKQYIVELTRYLANFI